MNRSRILAPLGFAALLALALLAVLRMHTGSANSLELPSGAQAAGEKSAESSPPLSADQADARLAARESASEPAPAIAPTGLANLTIELVAAGQPVKEGAVELQPVSGDAPLRASVDPATGCAGFPGLAPGTYVISLPELPRGLAPPRAFRRHSRQDDEVQRVILVGADLTRRIQLEATLHVQGYVRTPDGQLAKSTALQWGASRHSTLQALFTLKSNSWEESVAPQSFDVFDGRYDGDLVEGLWIATISGQPYGDNLRSELSLAPPTPALRRLAPGPTTEIDFDFRMRGSCQLRGSIHDEAGEPFGGLRMTVEQIHTLVEPRSREELEWLDGGASAISAPKDGTYQFPGVPAGRYRLGIEPEGYHPMSPPGAGKVGEVVQYRDVELVDDVTSLELTIRRPRPVHVTGRVVIDAAWAKEHAAEGILPMMDLVRASGRDDLPDTRDPVRVRAEGFEFWIDAGVKDPRLELWLSTEKLVEVLHLSAASEAESIVIRIPR